MQALDYTILLVDDDIRSLTALADILSREGYTTISASDGHDAVDKAKDITFDIAILDFNLPDMNGVELLKQIKLLRPEAPIIIMSADRSPRLILDVLEAEAYTFLPKPINLTQLRRFVSRALSSYGREVTQTVRIEHQSRIESHSGFISSSSRTIVQWSRRIIGWRSSARPCPANLADRASAPDDNKEEEENE